jgi:hypothetical protein
MIENIIMQNTTPNVDNQNKIKYLVANYKISDSTIDTFFCTTKDCSEKFNTCQRLCDHFKYDHKNLYDSYKIKYVCIWKDCKKIFYRPKLLTDHLWTHHKPKLYKCDQENCYKIYNNRYSLYSHKILHENKGKSKFICSSCNKKFDQKNYLRNHEKTHIKNIETSPTESKLVLDDKDDDPSKIKYLCVLKDCKKIFIKLIDLTKHVRTCHNNKSYDCDYENCGKSFMNRTSLCKHKKTHNKNSFKCPWPNCEIKVSRKDNMKKHKNLHINKFEKFLELNREKINSSEISELFNNDNRLIKSESYFSKVKNFAKKLLTNKEKFNCSWANCHMKFTTSENLKKHEESHTSELDKLLGINQENTPIQNFDLFGNNESEIDFSEVKNSSKKLLTNKEKFKLFMG